MTATTRVLGAATCRGIAATVTGTPGDDVLLGTTGADRLRGGRCFGGAGADSIRDCER